MPTSFSISSSKSILIAGGAGFIGSHLADRFLREGYKVVVLDNLISGHRDNISHLLDNPRFSFVNHDLTQPLPPDLGTFEVILHFASPASPSPTSPVSYMAHPIETLMVNSMGTKNLLDLAKNQNAQIVLASTSEIYGNPLVHPQPETYLGNVSCNGIRSCYDEAKRFMEAIAFAYFRRFGTKIKVVRIFNTYGPRMRLDDGRFIPNLITSYLTKTPFVINGNGNYTRSFGYVSDLVEGIWRVVNCDAMIGEVINLGNPTELSLKEAIAIFESVVGEPLLTKQGPPTQDDPTRRCPDITKAKTLLGWEPEIDFQTGLKETLAFYKNSPTIHN